MDLSTEKMRFIYEQLVDMTVEELRMYGMMSLPYIAMITAIDSPERETKVPISKDRPNETRVIMIEPRLRLNFKPTDGFKKQVNGKAITRAEHKRIKAQREKELLIEKEKERMLQLERKWKEDMQKVKEMRTKLYNDQDDYDY